MSGARVLEIGLLGLLLLGLLAHALIEPDVSKRNPDILSNMVTSPSYDAHDPNPNFSDGATIRPSLAGTVGRGEMPLMASGVLLDTTTPTWKALSPEQQGAWEALAAPRREGAEAENERKVAEALSLERGRTVYQRICATCHGPGGKGKTPVTQRGVPPPPSLLAENIKAMSDGRLFRIITAGQGNMAAHAAQVVATDRWHVIRFIRSLQGGE